MNNHLDELRKWSEGFTRSAWEGISQMLHVFQIPQEPAKHDFAGDLGKKILQLNQITLSVLEQFRYWEKLNDSMKQLSDSLLRGMAPKPDERLKDLESTVDELKAQLREQEAVLKELQSQLQADESTSSVDTNRTTQILSDFLARQTQQFQKLAKAGE